MIDGNSLLSSKILSINSFRFTLRPSVALPNSRLCAVVMVSAEGWRANLLGFFLQAGKGGV